LAEIEASRPTSIAIVRQRTVIFRNANVFYRLGGERLSVTDDGQRNEEGRRYRSLFEEYRAILRKPRTPTGDNGVFQQ
jgi:hypothetical protein